jgi:hypothetical protein
MKQKRELQMKLKTIGKGLLIGALTLGGIALLIVKPIWCVCIVGIGILLFLAFLLSVDYIGAWLCKHRKP